MNNILPQDIYTPCHTFTFVDQTFWQFTSRKTIKHYCHWCKAVLKIYAQISAAHCAIDCTGALRGDLPVAFGKYRTETKTNIARIFILEMKLSSGNSSVTSFQYSLDSCQPASPLYTVSKFLNTRRDVNLSRLSTYDFQRWHSKVFTRHLRGMTKCFLRNFKHRPRVR